MDYSRGVQTNFTATASIPTRRSYVDFYSVETGELGWGQSFGTCAQITEHVFEDTGTIGLTGGKLDGNRCDYTLKERMREVRYVHRTDWN